MVAVCPLVLKCENFWDHPLVGNHTTLLTQDRSCNLCKCMYIIPVPEPFKSTLLYLSGNNLSGVAVQFATQFGANAMQ